MDVNRAGTSVQVWLQGSVITSGQTRLGLALPASLTRRPETQCDAVAHDGIPRS